MEEWTRGKVLRGWGPVSVGIVSGVTRRRSCEKMPLHPVVADKGTQNAYVDIDKTIERSFHQYFPTDRCTYIELLKARIQLIITVRTKSYVYMSDSFFASVYLFSRCESSSVLISQRQDEHAGP